MDLRVFATVKMAVALIAGVVASQVRIDFTPQNNLRFSKVLYRWRETLVSPYEAISDYRTVWTYIDCPDGSVLVIQVCPLRRPLRTLGAPIHRSVEIWSPY